MSCLSTGPTPTPWRRAWSSSSRACRPSTWRSGASGRRRSEAAREHAISVSLQRSLLPAAVPSFDRLDVAVRYVPAGVGSEVGGDWYDVIELARHRVGLVIGDVMGHGVRQAAVMGQLRLGTRAYAQDDGPLDEVVRRVDVLLQNLGDVNTEPSSSPSSTSRPPPSSCSMPGTRPDRHRFRGYHAPPHRGTQPAAGCGSARG